MSMVLLNILIFDFSPSKIFLRLLVPPKNFIHEINPCSQCRAETNFKDKIFERTKSLRNILQEVKSNIGIFKRTIYLLNLI